MGMRAELDAAIGTMVPAPQDGAAVQLAREYADAIDLGADLSKVGPALLACLESLGMTPRARKAVKSDGQQPSGNPLDQLAAARARKSRAEDLHSATP